MEDNAEGMALSRAQSADAMAEIDPVRTSLALYRAVVNGESHGITLSQGHHLWPRLHAGSLLGEDKFPTRKITARLRQQDCDLNRKHMLAVKILM